MRQDDFREVAKKARAAKEEEQRRQEESEAITLDAMSRSSLSPQPAPERVIELDEDEDLQEFYDNWLQSYKAEHPDFDEDKNKIEPREGGGYNLCFEDPDAEEDFVRSLAARGEPGRVIDHGCGKVIATFRDGELIDPRTNEAFPEGGYANLVSQLDAGVPYDDITVPEHDESRRQTL